MTKRSSRVSQIQCASAFLTALFFVASCGGNSGGSSSISSDIKSPYPKYTATTRSEVVRSGLGGTTETLTFAPSGQDVTIGGKTFHGYTMTGTGPTAGTAAGVGRVDGETLEVASAQFTSVLSSLLGISAAASATLDPPLAINLNPPVGQPQAVTLTGAATVGAAGTPEALSLPATYTLTETNVTVETPGGTISGCRHFTASTTLKKLFLIPMEAAGEFWYSPTLGLVKAEMTKPLAGFGTAFLGSSDSVDLGGGYASVHKVGIVGGGGSSTFKLSTYDRKQAFDADKNTHAKMLVEVRFVDKTAAKTTQKPFIANESYMFGTVVGSFGSALEQSPVSIFHPEENGQGYVYWFALVNEAAKNEAQNGIAYQLNLNYDPSFSAIRVTSRIIYKVLAQAQ